MSRPTESSRRRVVHFINHSQTVGEAKVGFPGRFGHRDGGQSESVLVGFEGFVLEGFECWNARARSLYV